MPRTPSDPTLHLPDGTELAVDVRAHPRARKWSLRYDLAADRVRLVMPKRGSRRAALAWAEGHVDWVARQRAKRAARTPLAIGATIPFRGEDLRLVHQPEAGRTVRRDGDCLVAGGPADAFEGRIARWLRTEAQRLLDADSRAIAARAEVTIAKVGVGDARTRWGSCSSEGTLRYSWRLVLMPDTVRRYVVAHEVAHRRYMNHGPDFRALEAELHGGPVGEVKRLLRLWGERVRLIG